MIEAMMLCSMALAVRLELFCSRRLPDGVAYPISAIVLLVSVSADCKECMSELVMMIQTHYGHNYKEMKWSA